ncbi:polysaccharide deacetylase family protein [Brevibacillus porteri]|uniref:Chitooligosaccharide deacetylase n=1 Tax=Brevibacillus porteri TaxID=2126350 RepID=A0ABX5FRQ1_9BACL|nr:polysaccharide deacetylase family protein [Brevibacillus porteri]MED1799638.1 polysaccharide deacetylase family protein [Brevibacillus porteri]MED2133078.1 polysaccharide deacetylase family protein [Brevibacillus porteri]MED2747420.1 polysaccharide deacetylase family protein [Brevibacillus porteri]MED2813869.1 polysaccharide deacetylase family protein [Brevibacillus porteri]MED2893058.1 polysaccharide deacetylase family protein [Brevibacillus porteri]
MKKHILFFPLLLAVILAPSFSETANAIREKNREYYETRGDIVWEVPTESKVIALTFDDGPDQVYTPQIAGLLKQYQAKSTFFVVGNRVSQYPEIVKSLVNDQHEIANHTYSHPDIRKLSANRLLEEVQKTQETIYSATGVRPTLFRPPGGYYDEKVVDTAKQAGFLLIMWSWHQDTRDWSDPGVKKIVNKVLNNARNGDIVLFHDYGGNRRQTVQALEQVLPELKNRGYKFVTVSELLRGYGRAKQVDYP